MAESIINEDSVVPEEPNDECTSSEGLSDNAKLARRFILGMEGEYANHPNDNGGPTMRGVTQRTYDGYRNDMELPLQDVRMITAHEHEHIFTKYYWEPVQGNHLYLRFI